MNNLRILFLVLIIFRCSLLGAQQDDPVLFTVEDNPVHLSEFNYIYNKNNGDKADYSRESVTEYLELYKKFKLKVQKAKDMQLDTIPALISELAGYRKQLADSYLTDKEVTEKLIREVYERQNYDVKVRHLVIRVNQRATINQKMMAKERIEDLYQKVQEGSDFIQMIKNYSQDINTRNNRGELSYLSAMLPDGYYEFENAMYSLEKGEISKPIQSGVGYHLVQLIDKRPARGTIEAAHILLRKKKKNIPVPGVQEKIDSLHQLLLNGADFADLAKNFSEDVKTSQNGGEVGVFGIGVYEKAFEDAAFSLEKDGEFSTPIETSIGWHIIKRISKPERESYEKARRRLQAQIRKDSRYEIAKSMMIEQIKKEAGLVENKEVLASFYEGLENDFYSYKWNPGANYPGTLFSLGGRDYPLTDFVVFCKENTRVRLRFNKSKALKEAVEELYEQYLNDLCLKYEEENLEQKYPDFKALMREYEEGILLFEATKINVWDKASKDTAGLKAFFERNQSNYFWKERAETESYVFRTEDEKLIKKLSKYIKRKNSEQVLAKFSSEEFPISFSKGTYERGDREVAGIKFKKNAVGEPRFDQKSQVYTIKKITNIIPAKPKTLDDARGYIIADYQDYLDKKWVEGLYNKYSLQVNEEVLNSIIKG